MAITRAQSWEGTFSGSSKTQSITVTADTDKLVVTVNARSTTTANRVISSVTFNGNALTAAVSADDSADIDRNRSAIYYLDDPSPGSDTTANLVVTMAGSIGTGQIGAEELNGAADGAPASTASGNIVNTTSDTHALSFTTTEAIQYSAMAINTTVSGFTGNTGDTWDVRTASHFRGYGYDIDTTGSSITTGGSWTGNEYGVHVAAIWEEPSTATSLLPRPRPIRALITR